MIKVGEHITLDIIGTTKEYDPSVYEKVINKIAKAADVTILNISKYKFEPQGFTILALLAESHISFHTFPEKGIISFDFFTCGKVSPSVAIEIIKNNAFDQLEMITRNLVNDFYYRENKPAIAASLLRGINLAGEAEAVEVSAGIESTARFHALPAVSQPVVQKIEEPIPVETSKIISLLHRG